jgi:hypothetical protein
VVVAARTAAEIEKTAEEIRAAGRRALAIVCDITDGTQVTSDDDLREELERVPLGRPAKREDAVGGAIHLASSASEYATGKTIDIDGGLTRARDRIRSTSSTHSLPLMLGKRWYVLLSSVRIRWIGRIPCVGQCRENPDRQRETESPRLLYT